jgi:prefoldin subunit 5
MTDTLNDVLVTLTKFINGDSKDLQNYIILGMNKVAGFYKQFLDSSLDVLYKATEGIGNLMDGTSIASNVPQSISGNNNIIINIDLSDSAANSYTAAVTALSETENKIVTAIGKTNDVLSQVVEKVSALNGLHAASVQYVNEKDKELNTKMVTEIALV